MNNLDVVVNMAENLITIMTFTSRIGRGRSTGSDPPTLDKKLHVVIPFLSLSDHPLLESVPSLPQSLPTPFFAFEPSSPFSPGAYQRGDH